MSEWQIEDPMWKAIGADPELANARRKLSFHEIRLIVRHAMRAPSFMEAAAMIQDQVMRDASPAAADIQILSKDGAAWVRINTAAKAFSAPQNDTEKPQSNLTQSSPLQKIEGREG